MKYNNINSNLNPLDDELNKKHAQYEEFRDNLSNESIFSKKPQGYVTLKNDFSVIDQEDWAVRTNYYEQLKEVIPQQDLKALSDGIHECKTGFKTEDWSGNFSIAAVKTGKIKQIKATKSTDWYEHLMANLNVKYPCYLSKNNLYVISVNGFKLPVLKDWVNLYQSDLENGSTGTTNFAIEESKNNALAISQNIETQMNQLNLADSFDVPELARMKEEFEVKKAELESMLKEMYQKQAAIREQLQHEIELNQQKLFVKSADLYALEYRLGFPVEFKQLLQGTQAELETPVSIHQKVYFLDEDLPRISLLTNIPEVKSVEELLSSSPAALNYLVPSKKGISFVKMSRNNKDYSLNKDHKLTYSQKFHANQVGIIVRNNENVWFAWCDADKVKLTENSFASRSVSEELDKDLLASRYFIFNLILGLLERGDLLSVPTPPKDIAGLEFNQYVVFSNADAQIESHPYLPFADIVKQVNDFVQKNDTVYIPQTLTDGEVDGRKFKASRGKSKDRVTTYGATVSKGFNVMKDIEYKPDFTEIRYVSANGYSEKTPNFRIDEDEFILTWVFNSTVIDYYLASKQIGDYAVQGVRVDFAYMASVLAEISQKLKEQEEKERLLVSSKLYDLGLISSFKLLNGVKVLTKRSAKTYEKWVSGLSDKELEEYKDYKVINKAQELLAAQQKTRYFVGFETDGKIFYLNKKLGGSYSYGYYKHYQISQFETYAKDENIFVVLTDLPVQVYTSKTIAEKLRKEMLNVEKTFSFNGETYEKPEWRVFEFSKEEVSKYHKHISLEEMKNGKD